MILQTLPATPGPCLNIDVQLGRSSRAAILSGRHPDRNYWAEILAPANVDPLPFYNSKTIQ
jgi:hypothetical protein